MTSQNELDRLLGDFFAPGTNELADRVLDAALTQIDHTRQRRPAWVPRRYPRMTLTYRFAVAAVVGVVAVGGALYLVRPSQTLIGNSSPTPGASASPRLTTSPGVTSSPGATSPGTTTPPIVAASPLTAKGTWTATGSMTEARREHAAILLRDGDVLVVGNGENGHVSAELYHPKTGTWTSTGDMVGPHEFGFTATLLADGRVLVAGGAPTLGSAELYDPATGTWSSTGNMIAGRSGHTATLLPDGRVLMAGGFFGNQGLPTAEIYTPSNGSWASYGPMVEHRTGHAAVLLPDGRVLLMGGWTADPVLSDTPPVASAEIYDPLGGYSAATGSMGAAGADFAATLLPDGKVLVITPFRDSPDLTSVDVYDSAAGTWSNTLYRVPIWQTATLLKGGRVLLAGGETADGASGLPITLSTAELFDPVTGSWFVTGSMIEARSGFTATLLPSGKVLVAGGDGYLNFNCSNSCLDPKLASAELFDPAGIAAP